MRTTLNKTSTSLIIQKRYQPLDWLRGVLAVSIMAYHYLGIHDCRTVIGRLGIYSVSMFFILSGLSMAIAYENYIVDLRTTLFFYVRRVFRIWPLLWFAISIVVIAGLIVGAPRYSLFTIVINLTTLFGFIAPGDYINTGAWSIGNEMVYYALTPIILYIFRLSKLFGALVTVASFSVSMMFAFDWLNPDAPLAAQWATYINPFNNLFLFFGGISIFHLLKKVVLPNYSHLLFLMLGAALMVLISAEGDPIEIVTGTKRICFSLSCFLIVTAFFYSPTSVTNPVATALESLGIATYSIYLLHPIVMQAVMRLMRALELQSSGLAFLMASTMTVIASILVFKFVEKPFVGFGKSLTKTQ